MKSKHLIANLLQRADRWGATNAMRRGAASTPKEALFSIAKRAVDAFNSSTTNGHSTLEAFQEIVLEHIVMEALAALGGVADNDDSIVWRGFAMEYPIRVYADGRVTYRERYSGKWYDTSATDRLRDNALTQAVIALSIANREEVSE